MGYIALLLANQIQDIFRVHDNSIYIGNLLIKLMRKNKTKLPPPFHYSCNFLSC